MTINRELPRYRCHKEVWALKIKSIEHLPNPEPGRCAAASYGAVLTPEDGRYAPFEVSDDYMMKHRPQAGGYYVLYQGGYQSYSPADAFEGGYTPI